MWAHKICKKYNTSISEPGDKSQFIKKEFFQIQKVISNNLYQR